MQVVLDRRVWKVLGVFSIYELTLAVCRDYFSASQVLALVDCLPEGHMQPLVVSAAHTTQDEGGADAKLLEQCTYSYPVFWT